MLNRPITEFKRPEDIIKNGQLLGNGKLGYAYKIGDSVYKIYQVYHDPQYGYDPAEVSARYWNQVYQSIYNKKYQHLATAEHMTLYSHKRQRSYHILKTPFIDGQELTAFSSRHLKSFNQEFEALSLEMHDYAMPGNLRKDVITGDILPVDFDNVFMLPRKTGCCSVEYDYNPPSPRTKQFATYKHGRFFVSFKSPPPVEEKVEEVNQPLLLDKTQRNRFCVVL